MNLRTIALGMTLSICLSACGGGQDLPGPTWAPEAPAAAIQFHALDVTPGCYQPRSTPVVDGSLAPLLSARQQMTEFQLASLTQLAKIFVRVVEADPTAKTWTKDAAYEEGSTHIEGRVEARGADFSVLTMLLIARRSSGQVESHRVEITNFPERTIFDFGDRQLEVADDLVRWDGMVRGCDPETGRSFSVGPGVVGGEIVDTASECWNDPQPIVDPAVEGEFRASERLQCQQLIAAVML